MADLLDFKNQGNFDFFNVSSYYGDQQRFKSALKADCEKVLEYTHKTMQDMCMLGYQLKELKESGRWQWVKNPETGYCFEGGEFAEFSNYAFGFSKTKTSDLLRISKFVQKDDTNQVFLGERYTKYNTSQLVELASVEDGRLHYFNPEMTVEEMRLVKKYLETVDCWNKREAAQRAGREFDALAYAQAWKAREEEKKNKPQLPEGVLPGQTSIEDFTGTSNVEQDDDDELEEEEENPTSDLADESDEEETNDVERAREAARQAGIPFSDKPFDGVDDDFNPLAYDGSMSVEDYKQIQEQLDEDYAEPPEGGCYQGGGLDYDFDDDIGCDFRTDKYNFKTRAGVREFLHDYQNWEKKVGFLGCFFKNTYQYRFRNGTSIWGVTVKMIDKVDGNLQSVEAPQFYIWEDETKNASLISQTQIEQYCALHKDEL